MNTSTWYLKQYYGLRDPGINHVIPQKKETKIV